MEFYVDKAVDLSTLKPGYVYHTDKYSLFKPSEKNRGITLAGINTLKRSIRKKNFLCDKPVLVGYEGGNQLILRDGHRRHSAVSTMDENLHLYFIIATVVTNADLPDLNSVRVNWAMLSAISFHRKLPHYAWLMKQINYGFSPTISCQMASRSTRRSFNGHGIPDGQFTFDIDKADALAKVIYLFNHISFFKTQCFMTALMYVFVHIKQSTENLIKLSKLDIKKEFSIVDYIYQFDKLLKLDNKLWKWFTLFSSDESKKNGRSRNSKQK